LAGGQRNNKQFNDYIPVDKKSADNETDKEKEEQALNTYYHPPDTVWTPRVLKDGSDSVGALGRAESRISEHWDVQRRVAVAF